MKKTIALMLAMLFAVCAFATTAFAETTTAAETTTEKVETTTEKVETTTNDDPDDGFNTTTTAKADETTTAKADETTTAKADTTTTTAKTETTTAADVTATLAPGETAYEGQGSETTATTKKPAKVDTTIPSTGSGIVVPAIALAVLAAGTVAVIKTKKED